MSFAFIAGFVAKAQAPPLLLGLRASLYRPNQRETIAMGDCYIPCGRSGVTWSAWAAHRQRCEQFHFAARCSMKELSKTTVSFWLRMLLSQVCRLSVTERSVLCLLARCARAVALSLLCEELCCHPGGGGVDVAFALILERLLRGRCPLVPRSLPPVLCGVGAGPGFARDC